MKQAAQLRLLNELSAKLQSLIESDSFHQELLNVIQGKLNYESLHFWSVTHNRAHHSPAQPSARLKALTGTYRNQLHLGQNLSVLSELPPERAAAQVLETQKSQLSNHSPSSFCIPIFSPGTGELLGILGVLSPEPNAFDENDVITLESISFQIAIAMVNQKLFQETKDFNKKLQTAVQEKTLELRRAHERILEQQSLLQKENKALKTLVRQDSNTEIIGKSPGILSIISMVDKIAPTAATVVILGESGTGKELIAKRLHQKSERAHLPYITINCGALQESLLESELFGHEKGAFTGAHTQKIGLCEAADGGTLFLDEIGELSLGIQAKLLRFLQEGEFYRIGGKKPIRVNARIISATNRDLEKEVQEKRFREDLFYRLNTITLKLPALRKRKEDIPLLVESFLKNTRFKRMAPEVMDILIAYDWPGNIRELHNTIERLKILAEDNEIRMEDIPFNMRTPKDHPHILVFDYVRPLEEVEKTHILRTLSHLRGNKTKTAQALGITIKTLYNKLSRYGITENTGEKTLDS